MMKFLAALAFLFICGQAFAQVPPYVYPIEVTTGSAQVLPVNPARKKLIFHNPNDSIKVAICPLGPSRSGNAVVTAAINGAGCITILPYDRVEISGSTASGPQLSMPSAWIATGSGSGNLTIFEFE